MGTVKQISSLPALTTQAHMQGHRFARPGPVLFPWPPCLAYRHVTPAGPSLTTPSACRPLCVSAPPPASPTRFPICLRSLHSLLPLRQPTFAEPLCRPLPPPCHHSVGPFHLPATTQARQAAAEAFPLCPPPSPYDATRCARLPLRPSWRNARIACPPSGTDTACLRAPGVTITQSHTQNAFQSALVD